MSNLAGYIDEIESALGQGKRFEDVIRGAAMQALGLDEDTWRIAKRAPGFGNNPGISMSRLYERFGDDVYNVPNVRAANIFSQRATDPDTLVRQLAAAARDNDDALVDVYRAAPRWVSDIETGDWVTPSLDEARRFQYGLQRPGRGSLDIIRGQARAGDLYAGPYTGILEYGYAGEPIRSATRVTGNVPEDSISRALAGDKAALERVAKWYGLQQLTEIA